MTRVVLLWVGLVAVARADPATEARVFYRRGLALASSGRHAEAVRAFLQSQAVARNPNTLLAIAGLYDALGEAESAFASYAELETTAIDPTQREAASRALRALRRRVAAVAIETEPPGVDAYLARESRGRLCRTPCRVAVAPGPQRLLLRLGGWRPAEVGVDARRGEETPVRVRLERVTGTLRVRTTPAGAVVLATGPVETRAETPADLALPPGRYEVEIGGAAWTPARREVAIEADRTLEVEVSLMPRPPPRARLLLTTGASGARVTIDDHPAGFSPLMLDVEPGAHRIRVTDGAARWEGDVAFAPREHVRVFAPLASERPARLGGPLTALGAGIGAGVAGAWLLWKEDMAVPGTTGLVVSGAALAVAIGLVLDQGGTALSTRIEREHPEPPNP